MRCSNCGAELDANATFCNVCGAPITPFTPDPAAQTPLAAPGVGDDEKTLVLNPAEAGNVPKMPPEFAQGTPNPSMPPQGMTPNMPNPSMPPQGMTQQVSQAPQGMNPGMPPQGMAPQGMQPQMQPQGMAPQGMQPQMQPQGMAPQGMQPQGMAPQGMQPQMQPRGMAPQGMQPQGMPQQGMGMMQPQGMPQQMGYGQPMYNQAPKPPKKPMSTGAKLGIIFGILGAALIAVFFIVIFPMLTRAKLKGEYSYTDSWGDTYRIIYDDGTFVAYEDDGDVDIAGTYVLEGDKIKMTEIDGYTYDATFDKKKNTVTAYGEVMKSSDKKASIPYKLTDTFLKDLEDTVETIAASAAAGDEDIYSDLYWGTYIYDDDLKNPRTAFERELSSSLNYSSNAALQELIETGYLEIYVTIYSDGEVSVSTYVY